MGKADIDTISPAAGESWRTWLLTGARRAPIDRRRIRGAHVRLKRMLVEGKQGAGEQPYTWKEFSDAMARHAVGEAVRALPAEDERLVKLAYFGGCTNQELAATFGIAQRTVNKRLKDALELISAYVERGKHAGRRAVGMLVVGAGGRWLHDINTKVAQLGAAAGVAALVAGGAAAHQPAPPVSRSNAPTITAPATSGTGSPARALTRERAPVSSPPHPDAPGIGSVPGVSVPGVSVPGVSVAQAPPPPVPSSPLQMPPPVPVPLVGPPPLQLPSSR